MRLRLPELLIARGMSPYALAKESKGRISEATAYRWVRQHGKVKAFDGDMLEALCDVLNIGPGELLERDGPKTGRRKDNRT